MATALAEARGGPDPVVTGEFRLGDVRHITASSDLAREELGWSARVPLMDGVAGSDASRRPAPAGGATPNRQPPATFSTAIDPACASMTPLAMARPSPAPASSGVPRSGVARHPTSKTRARSGLGDAAAPVGDRDLDAPVGGAAGRHDDRSAPGGVPDRVAHQVGHGPGELVGVAAHGEPVVAGRHVEAQLHVAARGVGARARR